MLRCTIGGDPKKTARILRNENSMNSGVSRPTIGQTSEVHINLGFRENRKNKTVYVTTSFSEFSKEKFIICYADFFQNQAMGSGVFFI